MKYSTANPSNALFCHNLPATCHGLSLLLLSLFSYFCILYIFYEEYTVNVKCTYLLLVRRDIGGWEVNQVHLTYETSIITTWSLMLSLPKDKLYSRKPYLLGVSLFQWVRVTSWGSGSGVGGSWRPLEAWGWQCAPPQSSWRWNTCDALDRRTPPPPVLLPLPPPPPIRSCHVEL